MMGYKDILVCLDPTDAGESRLRLAGVLARRFEAFVSAAYILPEEIAGAPPYGLGPPTGAAWLPQTGIAATGPDPGADPALRPDVAGSARLAEMIELRFQAELGPYQSDAGWYVLGSGESRELLTLVNAADLVIFGQGSPDYHLPTGYRTEDVILAGGRPTLVVPHGEPFLDAGRRVLIGWDGTREATRAVHDALPILRHAEAVKIVTVRDDPEDFFVDQSSIERITRHLGRHGVAASAEEVLREGTPIGDVLMNRAGELDADLIVAGAYHHSQLRESFLSGASIELLNHMTLPVLMSH